MGFQVACNNLNVAKRIYSLMVEGLRNGPEFQSNFYLLIISVLHISESTNNMNLIILVEQILSLKCTFWSNLLIVTKQTRTFSS